MLRYTKWWHASFGHIANAIITLYKAEKQGKILTISQLRDVAQIPETTFYRTIRNALEKGGFVVYKVNERERIIEVYLTEKGRRLAECLVTIWPEGVK